MWAYTGRALRSSPNILGRCGTRTLCVTRIELCKVIITWSNRNTRAEELLVSFFIWASWRKEYIKSHYLKCFKRDVDSNSSIPFRIFSFFDSLESSLFDCIFIAFIKTDFPLNSQIDFMFQVCRRSEDCTFSKKMCASPNEGVRTLLIIARNLGTWLKFNVKNATFTEIILVKFNLIQIIDKLDYLTHMSENWSDANGVQDEHGVQKEIHTHEWSSWHHTKAHISTLDN